MSTPAPDEPSPYIGNVVLRDMFRALRDYDAFTDATHSSVDLVGHKTRHTITWTMPTWEY